MRFKIDWASLIVGGKFAVFALFYFVFKGNFPYYKPPGGLYLEGQCNGGFFALAVWGGIYLEGLIFGILRYEVQNLEFFLWTNRYSHSCMQNFIRQGYKQMRLYY